MKGKFIKTIFLIAILSSFVSILLTSVYSTPIGPTATLKNSSTRAISSNTTINESTGGGYIYTYTFDAIEQNKRWKAYVGNVTGTLTLDDANGISIYDWDLGVTNSKVYATRNSSAVNWTNINCSWTPTGNYSNRTVSQNEDAALQHTRLDNITATFNQRNHSSFQIGDRIINTDTCYSIFPFVNDTRQTSTTYFEEVLLYDGSSIDNGKIIYATIAENDLPGYNNVTYDFQMLVPEVGASDWSSSTAYYFYVELV